jgi:antitoxin component HigA of HigAB toxin-antitoxin module
MEITLIHTEKDYRAALRVVSALVDQDPSPDHAKAHAWMCSRP